MLHLLVGDVVVLHNRLVWVRLGVCFKFIIWKREENKLFDESSILFLRNINSATAILVFFHISHLFQLIKIFLQYKFCEAAWFD